MYFRYFLILNMKIKNSTLFTLIFYYELLIKVWLSVTAGSICGILKRVRRFYDQPYRSYRDICDHFWCVVYDFWNAGSTLVE